MLNEQSIIEIIQARSSCRTSQETPIALPLQQQLAEFMDAHAVGPMGARVRLSFIAATEEDRQVLKGLSTYGFIKGATGFILGAIPHGDFTQEDFGYVVEHTILYATSLGLGTCWLGGTFAKAVLSQNGTTRRRTAACCDRYRVLHRQTSRGGIGHPPSSRG